MASKLMAGKHNGTTLTEFEIAIRYSYATDIAINTHTGRPYQNRTAPLEWLIERHRVTRNKTHAANRIIHGSDVEIEFDDCLWHFKI